MRKRIFPPALLALFLLLPAPSPAEAPDSLDGPLPVWDAGRDPLFIGAGGHAVDTSEAPPCGGEIPCGCGMRLTADVLLNEDITACGGIGLRIAADDVVLDCGGRRIEGTGWGTGVWNPGHRGVVIRNCVIRGFRTGLLALGADDLVLENCFFEENGIAGAWLHDSDRFTIRSNRFERCGSVGIGRKHGGVLTLDGCREGAIEGNEAADCGNGRLHVGGILLYGSKENRIDGNRLERIAEDNIWIRMGSHGNRVLRNEIRDSGMDGIWIRESDRNRVEGNDVDGTERYGIFVRSGVRNEIRGNDVLRAGRERYAGIGVGGLEYPSTGNSVAGNRIALSREGLRLEESAYGNRFEGNTVRDCDVGVRLGEGTPEGPNRFIRQGIEGSAGAPVLLAGGGMIAHFIGTPLGDGEILFEGPCAGSRVEVRWFIDGIVEDPSGAPIAGASVTLRNGARETVYTGTTGADGRTERIEAAAFARVETGIVDYNDHILRIAREGYAAEERTFTLEGDRTERFVLAPARTGVAAGTAEERAASLSFAAAPNPFRGETRLRFSLASPGPVTVRVYDVRGRERATLADRSFSAGGHALSWDRRDATGRPVPPGIYFARLVAGGRSRMTKLVVAAP